jgi:hypothetical protein
VIDAFATVVQALAGHSQRPSRYNATDTDRYLRLDFLAQLQCSFLVPRSRAPSPFELPQPGDFIAQLPRQRRLDFKPWRSIAVATGIGRLFDFLG